MKIIFLLIGVLASSWALAEESKDHLNLSATSGQAPLTIRVLGPEDLIKNAQGKMTPGGIGGCYVSVDWGDGTKLQMLDDCKMYLLHTYQRIGIYTVSAKMWHPNPDDSLTWDWQDQLNVTVH